MPKIKDLHYGEGKTVQLKALVTPTAKRLLDAKARAAGVSTAEMIERFARGEQAMVGES
jgi:hypothetical protein